MLREFAKNFRISFIIEKYYNCVLFFVVSKSSFLIVIIGRKNCENCTVCRGLFDKNLFS